jgi:signal transduction histidine kinase
VAALSPGKVNILNGHQDLDVFADPLFEKVFYNLIDNALRYGGEGLTAVRISARETDAGLLLACEDDGAGISDEDKKRLFERGYGKNTGFGLFLVREILGITGITIRETSEPGHGARFEMLVPKGMYRFTGK